MTRWKLVPAEATEAMQTAYWSMLSRKGQSRERWRRMLGCAPEIPEDAIDRFLDVIGEQSVNGQKIWFVLRSAGITKDDMVKPVRKAFQELESK